jgi:hypothetical protein
VYKGRQILNCCTNCAWAALEGEPPCTAVLRDDTPHGPTNRQSYDKRVQVDEVETYLQYATEASGSAQPMSRSSCSSAIDDVLDLNHTNLVTPPNQLASTPRAPWANLAAIKPTANQAFAFENMYADAVQFCIQNTGGANNNRPYKQRERRRQHQSDVFEKTFKIFMQIENEFTKAWEIKYQELAATWEEEDDECDICLNPFDDSSNTEVNVTNEHVRARTSCGHVFGASCLYQWHHEQIQQQGKSTCPKCRQRYTTIELIPSKSVAKQEVLKKAKTTLRKKIVLSKNFDIVRGRLCQFLDTRNATKIAQGGLLQSKTTHPTKCAAVREHLRKTLAAGKKGKLSCGFLTTVAAAFSAVMYSFWVSPNPEHATTAIGDAKGLAQEIIQFLARKGCSSATMNFVQSTLIRACRWSVAENDKAMRDLMDLFLLFQSFPNGIHGFEVRCQDWRVEDEQTLLQTLLQEDTVSSVQNILPCRIDWEVVP